MQLIYKDIKKIQTISLSYIFQVKEMKHFDSLKATDDQSTAPHPLPRWAEGTVTLWGTGKYPGVFSYWGAHPELQTVHIGQRHQLRSMEASLLPNL